MNDNAFTWGALVRTISTAPKDFRPEEMGEVCGIWTITNEENSLSRGEPVGTIIYTIEFGDGFSAEIPGRYLELIE